MDPKPKIKLALTATDKLLEVTGWIAVLTIWTFTIRRYTRLPDTIPTHFNALGVADAFGGKGNILTSPVLASLLFIGLTVVNRFPHIFNYPAKITAANAPIQYNSATSMIRYLKLVLVVIFGLIEFKTIQIAGGQANGLSVWFLPLALGFIFIPLTYFIFQSIRQK